MTEQVQPKFKVGDRVRVKRDLEKIIGTRGCLPSEIIKLEGSVLVIKEVNWVSAHGFYYHVDGPFAFFGWAEEWLMPAGRIMSAKQRKKLKNRI